MFSQTFLWIFIDIRKINRADNVLNMVLEETSGSMAQPQIVTNVSGTSTNQPFLVQSRVPLHLLSGTTGKLFIHREFQSQILFRNLNMQLCTEVHTLLYAILILMSHYSTRMVQTYLPNWNFLVRTSYISTYFSYRVRLDNGLFYILWKLLNLYFNHELDTILCKLQVMLFCLVLLYSLRNTAVGVFQFANKKITKFAKMFQVGQQENVLEKYLLNKIPQFQHYD